MLLVVVSTITNASISITKTDLIQNLEGLQVDDIRLTFRNFVNDSEYTNSNYLINYLDISKSNTKNIQSILEISTKK